MWIRWLVVDSKSVSTKIIKKEKYWGRFISTFLMWQVTLIIPFIKKKKKSDLNHSSPYLLYPHLSSQQNGLLLLCYNYFLTLFIITFFFFFFLIMITYKLPRWMSIISSFSFFITLFKLNFSVPTISICWDLKFVYLTYNYKWLYFRVKQLKKIYCLNEIMRLNSYFII